jgi:hypothetical protein
MMSRSLSARAHRNPHHRERPTRTDLQRERRGSFDGHCAWKGLESNEIWVIWLENQSFAKRPPSTASVVPVMNFASSLARNATAAAISSGVPTSALSMVSAGTAADASLAGGPNAVT